MPTLLLPWLAAAYTPDGRVHSGVLPVDIDTSACVSIAVPAASDAWCVNSCAAGSCPEELCQCGAGGEVKTASVPGVLAGSAAGSGGRDGG
eukprot:scaffold11443_cov29-Phaeocystis_antarctica.AAC.1